MRRFSFKNSFLWVMLTIILLIVIGLLIFGLDRRVTTTEESIFRADLAGLYDGPIDNAHVGSASEYLIITHLVRPLVRYDRDGQLIGDLASSWKINAQSTRFEFEISNQARWSDGKSILAQDIVEYFLFAKAKGQTTHFDFRQIHSVVVRDSKVIFELFNSNPHFLRELVHPEASLIKRDRNGKPDFSISAGSYILTSATKDQISMRENPFFDHGAMDRPRVIELSASNTTEEQLAKLGKGKIDFVVPINPPTKSQLKNVRDPSVIVWRPHTAYSFWFAPNGESGIFSKKENRRIFARAIRAAKIDFNEYAPVWTKADQLYLPDGFGRPSKSKIDEIWSAIDKSPKATFHVRVLVSQNFPLFPLIANAAAKEGITLDPIFYDTIAEFAALKSRSGYDAFQINNDFSSQDVLENLSVTFSQRRPLVQPGNLYTMYIDMLSRAKLSEGESRARIIRDIGISLLEEGFVVPVAYRNSLVFGRDRWDYSNWSSLFQDIRFWKISQKRGAKL